jgi:hypothetical protein
VYWLIEFTRTSIGFIHPFLDTLTVFKEHNRIQAIVPVLDCFQCLVFDSTL